MGGGGWVCVGGMVELGCGGVAGGGGGDGVDGGRLCGLG